MSNFTFQILSLSPKGFYSMSIYRLFKRLSFTHLLLLILCCISLQTHAKSLDCGAPEVLVTPKTLILVGTYMSNNTKLIYRDIYNRITDSCDGDLTFESSKVLMERVLSTDPLMPLAPRTLIANGTTTGLIGNAGLIDGSGNPATDGLVFTCAGLYDRQFVRVWAINNAGNWSFAVSTIRLQDNDGICEAPRGRIYGSVGTEINSPVKDVTVFSIVNGVVTGSTLTVAEGSFLVNYNVFDTTRFQLRATKTIETNKKNGVTTLDLALISKHNLGIAPLNSPYKIIAADINQDGEVDGIDMLYLRRFIMGITPTLGVGWRFIDKAYNFIDTAHPLTENFPEFINFPLPAGRYDARFTAVKLGDVNNSFDATIVRSSRTLTFNVTDRDLIAGNEYTVAIHADKFDVSAFQGTYAFDGATVKAITAGNLNNLSNNNFGLFANAVTAAWNGSSEASADLVHITFVATKSGKLSDMLTLNSAITLAEGYDIVGQAMNLKLVFDPNKMAVDAFVLYQNTPNPVLLSTTIGFNLPTNALATLTIYTAEGKVVDVIKNNYKAGYNEVTVNTSDWNASGILYYRLDTEGKSATRKMMVIK